MTPDGTTGSQVAPTGQEIEMAQNVFQKLANAIVAMSSLSEQVKTMQEQVNHMQGELDRLRRTNDALEESLSHSRQARQDLEQRNSELSSKLVQVENERNSAQRESQSWQDHANTNDTLYRQAAKERDDAQLRVMELEDQLKAANAKLDAIHEGYRNIFGGQEPPKAVQSTPEPQPKAQDDGPSYFQPEPEQAQPTEPSSAEPSPLKEVDWNQPYRWNAEQGRYENC